MFLTECPRDAMQGWGEFISTQNKIDYINLLLGVGFDVLDCGSFVSPKAIPQMADTSDVLKNLDRSGSDTSLSVIVANIRGAEKALAHSNVDIIGFPFSISETFQYRNTNKNQQQAFEQILKINDLVKTDNRNLNVYFSMSFGNPYGEKWTLDQLIVWGKRFRDAGILNIQLSDTIGAASVEQISLVFEQMQRQVPEISFGAHFHNRYEDSNAKIQAAYQSGCRKFDSAIKGIGGCPMAKDELVGNMPTEQLINFMAVNKIKHNLNLLHFESAYNKAKDIFKF